MAEKDEAKPVKLEDLTNGQHVKSKAVSRRRHVPRRSWKRWLLSNLTRIAVWYTIVTVVFRCPSNPKSLDADSPRVCQHYYTSKTYATPYVQPYYDVYASRYVEKAQPYFTMANERVIEPAIVLAVDKYKKYAAPQVAKASAYAQAQWEKNALPQLRRAQASAQQAYDENLAPQVLKVSEVATPYYETAKENALTAHEKHIIPAITSSQPHLYKAYNTAHKFMLEKGIPFAQHAWSNIIIFMDGTLWPFVKKIYGENVRPQLVMIGERIAKYQEGRKLQSAMNEFDRSVEYTSSEQTTSTTAVSSFTSSTATISSASETFASASASASQPPLVATDQTVSDDLIKWQKKFAIAADKGTDDLKDRIEDIITRLVKEDLGQGKGLANALGKTCEVQLDTMKAKIKSVVSSMPEEPQSAEVATAESEIIKTIQDAGSEIKGRARAVRSWHDTYRQELKQRTELATESTLHVLDDIRDLGLQEIGMRWAWMEGVTYKHWQKYHELKKRFADWRSEVRDAALSHPVLLEASEEADKVWEESMAVTEDAAKELIRLKDVARWKIAARDSSDDFDSRAVPAAAAAAASKASSIASGIKDALVGSSQGTLESLSSVASDKAGEASLSASSRVEDNQHSAVESVLSDVSSAVSPGSTGTVESLIEEASSTGSSLLSSASLAVEDLASRLSSGVGKSSTGSAESVASSVSSVASSAAVSGSNAIHSGTKSASESASSIAVSATTGPSDGIASSIGSLVDSISIAASSAKGGSEASQSLASGVDEAEETLIEVKSSWLPNKGEV